MSESPGVLESITKSGLNSSEVKSTGTATVRGPGFKSKVRLDLLPSVT